MHAAVPYVRAMAGASVSRLQQQLTQLEQLQNRVQNVHGLVERFAAERHNLEPHAIAVRRAFNRLKFELTGLGFDSMAQICAAMELAARQGGSQLFKARVLRDGVASLRLQLDVESRLVRSEMDEARSRRRDELDT